MTDKLRDAPKPVAWMNKDGFLTLYRQGDATIPLYTAPPSVDALIAELDDRPRYCAQSDAAIDAILDKYRARGGA